MAFRNGADFLRARPGSPLGVSLSRREPARGLRSVPISFARLHQPDQDADRAADLLDDRRGIGKTGDIKAVGRMGVKAIIYFEAATTAALVLGLSIAHIVRPGQGLTLP